MSLDTAATAKLLKPPLRRQCPAQRHPSLGGSRLAFARTSPARRPTSPSMPHNPPRVSEAKIGGAVSPEAGVTGGDRMGWVHRV